MELRNFENRYGGRVVVAEHTWISQVQCCVIGGQIGLTLVRLASPCADGFEVNCSPALEETSVLHCSVVRLLRQRFHCGTEWVLKEVSIGRRAEDLAAWRKHVHFNAAAV